MSRFSEYDKYSKKNVSYEEYVRLCYELAAKDANPEYAVAALKASEKFNRAFRYDYEEGRTVGDLVCCIAF